MASSLNLFAGEGILGIDAIKNENGGRGSIFFTLGMQQSWKDQQTGEWKSKMHWVPVVYSRSTSDKLVDALTKSTPVRVQGRIESYTKEVNGQNTTVVQVRADSIEFMPRFNRSNDDEGGAPSRRSNAAARPPRRQNAPRGRRQPEPQYDDEDEDESLWAMDDLD